MRLHLHHDRRADLAQPAREQPDQRRNALGELALVAPTLIQTSYGEREGQAPRVLDLHKPLGTVVAGGQKHGLVAAFLTRNYSAPPGREGTMSRSAELPLATVTTQDHNALITASLDGPDRREQVRAFLLAYYGGERTEQRQSSLFDPLHTTARRFGVVLVHGEEYEIADIGMRMLSPRELFRAQGFGDHYVLDLEHAGKPLTKTAQIALAGNSVCPPIAAAIVGANVRAREAVAA